MPVHATVPGRARLHIAGLRGNNLLKRALEAALPDGVDIRRADASTITGNALVSFDPALPLATIIERIERLNDADHAAAVVPIRRRSGEHDWHALGAKEVLALLESRRHGLSKDIARERLASHGRNSLPALSGRPRLAMLLEQFESLPVLLLAGAAALSMATGGVLDAAVILSVVALNAAIGFVTQSSTERIIGSLRLPEQGAALVRRDGGVVSVAADEVVPGDVLALRPGAIVPADARVIASNALTLDESMLTGESLPVSKAVDPLGADRRLSERVNMVYRSTAVVGGSGLAVAVATGSLTEAGQIQALVGEAHAPETPMQRQLHTLGRQLVWLSGGICGAVFVIGLLRGQGFLQMLKSSIALAVAAVPEGLPTVATTALALGIEEMRRRQILVRRLDAIETLASVNVVGFDKTGTLTENRMSATAIVCGSERFDITDGDIRGRHRAGDELQRLLGIAVLCNEATITTARDGTAGDAASPTEAALIRLAVDAGIDADRLRRRHPLHGVEYRSQNRHYMVTQHRDGNRHLMAVKGNPEQVLERCGWHRQGGRRRKLSKVRRQAIGAQNRALANEGLRVLGLAYAEQSARQAGAGDPVAARRLTWLGLVGLADPARRGVGATIAQFDRAGIRVIMMTGDQAATAEAIARQLNLANGAPAAMLEADHLHEADERALERTRIFARVSPAEKLQIVRALQRMGKVVAMTGDGINDSPALRAADVGMVMGRSGTDAARAVADVVLQSDDLSAMVAVLERGRTTYGNIRKAIHFLLATNLSEILVMLTETAAGLGSPLTPIQLLWINLLSDVLPAIGLALEPAEPGVLDQPPRDPDEAIVRPGDMAVLAGEGATIALGALAAHAFGLWRHGAAARAGTISFTSLVGAQLLHALTCRSSRYGLFRGERLTPNRPLGATLAASAALQLGVLTLPPLRRFMGLARMDLVDALVSVACAVLPYVANEAAKTLRLSRSGATAPESP